MGFVWASGSATQKTVLQIAQVQMVAARWWRLGARCHSRSLEMPRLQKKPPRGQGRPRTSRGRRAEVVNSKLNHSALSPRGRRRAERSGVTRDTPLDDRSPGTPSPRGPKPNTDTKITNHGPSDCCYKQQQWRMQVQKSESEILIPHLALTAPGAGVTEQLWNGIINTQNWQRLSPIDREPLVYHMESGVRRHSSSGTPPEGFFEVTVEDVKKRLAQLQSGR
ncbi:hypothetical protein JZ751_021590 [Albula glossodonta]|uniref:Uncharacterized protein n=1 Tax=Albula glossodonta TaxID=121402 RepID=A0A8T2NVR2_9TELE|nr:hypothetical protein JZ751_021590 [Albula glossodonta]